MTAHKHGPWVAETYPDGSFDIRSEGGIIVAGRNPIQHMAKESLANARLIAAAPEILDALESLHALVIGECPSLLEDDHHDELVRAAIAKAGGTP